MTETLGQLLRRIRKEKKLTLKELSTLSGVSHPYISQIERDEFKPSPDILEKLAFPLDLAYVDLYVKAGYLSEENAEEWSKFAKGFVNKIDETKQILKERKDVVDGYLQFEHWLEFGNVSYKGRKLKIGDRIRVQTILDNKGIDLFELLTINCDLIFKDTVLTAKQKDKIIKLIEMVVDDE